MNSPFSRLAIFCGLAFLGPSTIGCQQPKSPVPVRSPHASPVPQRTDYTQCKQRLAALKAQYARHWQDMNREKKQRLFTQAFTDSILPYWMGTAWGFYGTTETPNQGQIACGYFVTTTLRDVGLPLQRTKLAQCASEQMIRTLVQPAYIQRFSHVPLADFVASIKQQGYGLYLLGLDSHTGFLYHDGQALYFIHASYIGQKVVTKELADHSVILQASQYRITGKISADEAVLDRWARGS
jgi:hypothetical protein